MVCLKRLAGNVGAQDLGGIRRIFGMILLSSISLAQYPGSAGDVSSGAVGASSSASSGSSSTSASSSSGVGSDGSSDSSASGSMAGSDTSAGGSDDNDVYGEQLPPLCCPKALRKQALIRQFRLEFAKNTDHRNS